MKVLSAVWCIIILYSCADPVKKEQTVYVSDTTRVQDTVIFIKDSTVNITLVSKIIPQTRVMPFSIFKIPIGAINYGINANT